MLLGESPCAPVPAGVSSNVPLPVPFGLPKTKVIECVLASEKNNVWEHGRTFILTLAVTGSRALRVGNLAPAIAAQPRRVGEMTA